MKGSITLKILQALRDMSVEGIELCEAILVAGYGASSSKIGRIQENLREKRLRGRGMAHSRTHCIRNFQKLVSKLKAQGLLTEEMGSGDGGLFSLTPRGKLKLLALESRLTQQFPVTSYVSSRSARPVIISFDIPEKQRKKRGWVREVLKHLGLRMVQQSVWVGMVRIPESFLADLKKLGLLECIEIFEVGKTGTLRRST